VEKLKNLIFGLINNKTNLKKHFFISSIFILLATLLLAQNPSNIADFQFNKLDEKVILITDKDLYLSGGQIWFSSFYFQNGQLANKELSKVLYVELFSAKKDIIWQGKFSIDNAQSSGKIDIPSDIYSGAYFLRAYTQLQKNKPAESYFTKAIRIVNPSVPLPAPNQVFGEELIISPTGGTLIQNQENFIALRLKNILTGLLTASWVSDQYGNTIAHPVMYKNGLGYVYLTPVDSLQYTLKISLSDGDTIIKQLPPSKKSSLALSINHDGGLLNFTILNQLTLTGNQKNDFHLHILNEDKQVIADTSFNDNNVSLAESHFESKIYLCELTDSNNEILARQYFFGKNINPELLKVQTDKAIYKQREKVTLSIENTLQGDSAILSVSVTERRANNLDPSLLPTYLADNFLLLPFYMMENVPLDSAGARQLEIILQLNSYPFKAFFSEKTDSFNWPPETSDVNIAALLRYKKSKEPIEGRKVYVSVLGENPQLHVNKTLPDGMVYFSLTHSTNAKDIFLSAESKGDEEIELLVLHDFSPEIPDFVETPLEIDTTYKEQLEQNWKALQVENQYQVLEKLKTDEKLPAPARFGKPDYHMETKDFIELSNVEEMFKEVVPYTRLKKKAGEYYFEVMDPAKNVVYNDPLILIDDVPLFNYNSLANLPYSVIESVDVYTKQYIYGDFVFNGIVLIKTKTDNFAGLFMPYGSVFAVYQTITPEVLIQFPDYSVDSKKQTRLPEFRDMLFWAPDFKLTNKKTNLSFFTSDYTAEYDVVVRGLTKDGKPCIGISSFTVVPGK